MRLCKILAVGLCVAGLSACAEYNAGFSSLNNYASGQIAAQKTNIEGANDNAAKAWADVGCTIPYGTIVRNASTIPGLPTAVEKLCGVLPLSTTPSALGSNVATGTTK